MFEQSQSAPRVGVFGGSFDPIHHGHLEIARAARDRHDLDRLIFVPAYQQPHKRALPRASGADRVAMIRLATQGEGAFGVSDCELRREGTSFTIDTMRSFRQELGPEAKLFFVVGADSVPELPAWRKLEELSELCLFVVAARPGWSLDGLDVLAERLPRERVEAIKQAAIRTTANPASSTEIRERIASGRPIDGLTPDAVIEHINENKLYRACAETL